ncbi:MAG: serine/threonine-protein kinase PknK [Microscillaceae bacterium]|nr:serine/threonine-protein kinase PknK [Microscillaceae bacterium]
MKLSTPQILDYEVVETIYESDYSVVWRASPAPANGFVILKASQPTAQREQSNQRIEYEHKLLADLAISGLPKALALLNYEGNPLLVREYLPGVALSAYLQNHQFTLETFLKIAFQLCDIVGELHRQNIIHKDLNSNNIIYDAQTQKVYLIDFGSASRIDLKTQNLGNPHRLEGTLNYISPEQTGRMNRVVDYRSDLYSLGITLFEALTNHLPFPFADALELIHAHMAKIPPSPGTYRADVPEMLSKLILKLLAKNAEDRYQSAYGLKHDLSRIYAPLQDQLPQVSFALGSQDFPLKFQIPEKLYGREMEREALLRTFEQIVQGGKALLVVKGEPGTGKSALVDEVHKPMTARRGIFLEGKFDQLQKNIPYFAWSQVIDTFTERLLTEDESSLGQWRNKILAAVGNSGKILSDLNPNLELVIGKQPELPPMDVQETQNRFILTLKRFVGALASAEHPLIIFMDDWQWADTPSILLLENLFQDEALRHLFLIAAVRHNEVAPQHAFSQALEQMQAFAKKETDLPVHFEEIWLRNLQPEHIQVLLVDALRAPAEDLAPLQQLVFEKTQGNAFFVHQLLQSLYEEKLLQLEATEKGFRWQWDFEGIQALNITENVVGFMMRKIQKTDPITQQILKTAACIGNYFDLKILSAVYGKPLKVTYQDLWEGMKEGLIVPTDGARRMHSQFRFVHDRIQQAFYELIPTAEQGPTHYQIAQVLQDVIAERDLEVRIFDIINQFNQGREYAHTQAERDNIALLNLLACQKAQASAAYAPALSYAETGVQLLGAEGWQRNYSLTIALYQKKLENTYLTGDFAQTEALLQIIREKAQNQQDRVRATETQVKIFKAQGQLEKALQTGISLLETLRIRLAPPNTLNILRELLLTRNRIKVSKIERLLEKRQTTDPLHLAIERILVDMASVVYFVKPNLIPILVAQQVKVALSHGHTVYSPYSYASFGFLLIVGFKDIEAGYRVGQMAEALQRKLPSKQNEGRTNFILNTFIKHWKEPLQQVSANLRQVHQECLENGDFEFAGFAASIGTFYGFLGGVSLPLLKNYLDGYVKTAKEKIKAQATYEQIMSVMSTVAVHFSPVLALKTFDGADFQEAAFVQKLEEDKNLATLQTLRLGYLINAYLLEEYEQGISLISLFEQNIQASASGATSAVFHAYRALTYAALWEKAKPAQAKKYRAQIAKDEKTLRKWGQKSPANYQNRYWLVRGESLRLENKAAEAAQAFEEARRLARQHRNLAEEALALELMARLFSQQKQEALVDYFCKSPSGL